MKYSFIRKSFSSMSELYAISPLDGRYYKSTKELINYFSEAALMKYRVKVEIEWLLFLSSNELTKYNGKLYTLNES